MQPIAGLIDTGRFDLSMRIMMVYTTRKACGLLLRDKEICLILLPFQPYLTSTSQLMIHTVDFSDGLIIIHLHDRLA
jgi:hypothetical protein